jgi:hypothetical protein
MVLAFFGSSAQAQNCTTSIDFDGQGYRDHPNLDGVGMGSLDVERRNATYTAVGVYRTINGPNSLPNQSVVCVTYDDDSTEKFKIICQAGTACVSPIAGTFRAPSNWGGASAPGWYSWGGGGWVYRGPVGCIHCFWGEVGDVTPAPPPPTIPQ